MRCFELRFACVILTGWSLLAGAFCSAAAELLKSGDPGTGVVALDAKAASPAEESAIALTGPHAIAPAALLKTFNRPAAETSLNKRATLSVQGPLRRAASDSLKGPAPLLDVQAVAVPEPTALFLAGFAGFMLLVVGQRLRGSKL